MATAAQAAYNQRVLEGLKSFSGVHNDPSAPHWDEMDDDDDLEDILEFADGTRYEVPVTATLPTEAETAAFEEAERASHEAAALQHEYERQAAAEEAAEAAAAATDLKSGGVGPNVDRARPIGQPSEAVEDTPVSKEERFLDDFDRGARGLPVAVPPAGQETQIGRTLFNERLGRFEPYAKKGPPPARKEKRMSPPTVLQKPQRQPSGSNEQQSSRTIQTQQRTVSGNAQTQSPSSFQQLAQPLTKQAKGSSSPTVAKADFPPPPPPQHETKKAPETQPAPKKIESAWAKLPAVPKLPLQWQEPAPSASQAKSAPTATTTSSSIAAASSVRQAPIKQLPLNQPVPAPVVPQEDPEEAYKREMQTHAERARKRRQEEEVERQAQVERAKRKAHEIEERMREASNPVVPVVAAASARVVHGQPTSILSAHSGSDKPDRQLSWRRESNPESTESSQASSTHPQRVLLQPFKSESPVILEESQKAQVPTAVPKDVKTPQSPTSPAKAPPSSAAFTALANMASSSWRKPSALAVHPLTTARPQITESPADQKNHIVPKTILPARADVAERVERVSEAIGLPSTPSFSMESSKVLSINDSSIAPLRVRLGRTNATSEASVEPSTTAHGLRPSHTTLHAYPSSTLRPAELSTPFESVVVNLPNGIVPPVDTSAPPQLSALDKIMLQVRFAQAGLKAEQAAEASSEEERRRAGLSSSQEQFDGALSRISLALGEAAFRKGKAKETAPGGAMPHVNYAPELFDITQSDRPSSPRGWRVFSVRVPSKKRHFSPPPTARLQGFESPLVPQPVYPSSWRLPKGQKISRNITQDEYLIPRASEDVPIVVKFSKFPPASAQPFVHSQDQPVQLVDVSRSLIDVPAFGDETFRQGRSSASTWRCSESVIDVGAKAVEVEQESPAASGARFNSLLFDEEDFMTVPYEETSNRPAIINVSLPKSATAGQISISPARSIEGSRSPEIGRFKTYGPKLPDNSTVIFRMSNSNNKDSLADEPFSSNMFMVSSEIGQTSDGPAGGAETLNREEISASASFKEVQKVVQSMEAAGQSMPMSVPSMPEHGVSRLQFHPIPQDGLSLQAPFSTNSVPKPASPLSTVPYDLGRKFDIPKEVQQELDRLNAAVGTVSLVATTHESKLNSPLSAGPTYCSPATRFSLILPRPYKLAMGYGT